MLKPALQYEAQLKERFGAVMFDEEFMYSDISTFRDVYEAKTSTWTHHEFASVNPEGQVIGYISYRINRETNNVSGLHILNFEKGRFSPRFGRDLIQAIEDIFLKFRFDALQFTVVVGNPAERMYDKHLHRIGGRVVGTWTNDVRLIDGLLYNMKLYEVSREAFLDKRKVEGNGKDS